MNKVIPFTLGSRLRARLFEIEQGFKESGYEIQTKADRLQLESLTRLKRLVATAKPMTTSDQVEEIVKRVLPNAVQPTTPKR